MSSKVSWARVVMRGVVTFLALLPIAGSAILAYSSTRERIATVETKVKGLEQSIDEIKTYTTQSRDASQEVLSEIRKLSRTNNK